MLLRSSAGTVSARKSRVKAPAVICDTVAAMAKKAGEDVNLGSLSKGDASKTIEDLKEKTGM